MPYFVALFVTILSIGMAAAAATAALSLWKGLRVGCTDATPNRYAVLVLTLAILAIAAIVWVFAS